MDKTGQLYVMAKGVPLMTDPLWWDRRLPVQTNVNTIESYMREYQSLVSPGCYLDEAAIMVPGMYGAEVLAKEIGAAGWRMFNQAQDMVHAGPFGTRYRINYEFFEHPAKRWRLEVMYHPRAEAGFSPLHQALWQPDGVPPTWQDWSQLPIPHLSFKAPHTSPRLAWMQPMRDAGCIIAQACQSTYGQFWYMLPHDARRQLYLKPRINLRDGGEGGA